MTPEPEHEKSKFVGSTFFKVIIVLIIVAVYSFFGLLSASLFANIAKPYQVPSSSMMPAIVPNDRILVNRLIYGSSLPARGDVIVFERSNDDTPYVKRVIGIPGDAIEVRNGRLYVNGEEFIVTGADVARYSFPPETVPDGMLYVLGDNRNESADSHVWGPLSNYDMIGRVEYVYWPIGHWTFLSSNFVFSDLFYPISLLFFFLLMPFICSVVAKKRKRSMIGWFLLGILGLIPLIIIVLLPSRAQNQTSFPKVVEL